LARAWRLTKQRSNAAEVYSDGNLFAMRMSHARATTEKCVNKSMRMTLIATAIALAGCPLTLGAKYTVGGTLTGLHGTGLVLQDNGGKLLTLDSSGEFTLSDRLQNKDSYSVTVATQPTNPAQTCSVRNGSGTIGKTNVTNVIVVCIEAGRFAYVANQSSNNISAYAISSSGALGTIAGSPFATTEATPIALTVDPNGQFLYVVNNGSNDVSTFAIDDVTGELSSAGFPAPTGSGPVAVTIDPTDHFLYVANLTSNSVSAFSIDQASGLLSAVTGSPFAIGVGPSSLKVDPNGNFLYVANFDGADVSVLQIDPLNGALTAVSGSPFGAGTGPDSVVVDPTGAFAYVANQTSQSISEYAINASSGALTAVSGSPLGVSVSPESVGVDPAGRYIYVANAPANNQVSSYSITPASGALTLSSSVAAGTLPASVAVDPAGGFIYVANDNSGDISVYSVDSGSGALAAVSGSPFGAGSAPRSIAID
jgi:6-phosphogluconolactonase (cycloisomerase 2 family)